MNKALDEGWVCIDLTQQLYRPSSFKPADLPFITKIVDSYKPVVWRSV